MEQIKLKNGSLITIRNANESDAKKMIEYVNIISIESDTLTFGE